MKRFSVGDFITIAQEEYFVVEVEEIRNDTLQCCDFRYYLDLYCDEINSDSFLESEYDKIRSLQKV